MHTTSVRDIDLRPAALSLVPAWARHPFESSPWEPPDPRHEGVLCASAAGGLRAVAATIPGAAALDRPAFENRVARMYEQLLGGLLRDGYHPLRFWNFVPRLNEEMEPGLSRYMAFNAARFAAYRAVHARAGYLADSIATASCVGAPGPSFHVFCVATRERALPVENPRQVPAYEYSRRYGPQPPCFSRAMLVRSTPPLLVVGGTASVRGEDTVHARDLAGQVAETLMNLRTLLTAGCGAAQLTPRREPLGAFVSVRAYVVDGATAVPVRDRISEACGLAAHRVEVPVADLCRPDLLVEIEGIAMLDRATRSPPPA
jgi:chorismate lyase / 3-hydroxybenzoate synthase